MDLRQEVIQSNFRTGDLLLLLDRGQISFEVETKFMDELYDVEPETGKIISPLIYSKNDWTSNHSIIPIYEYIQKEGVRIK